jgi:hypothetical protein
MMVTTPDELYEDLTAFAFQLSTETMADAADNEVSYSKLRLNTEILLGLLAGGFIIESTLSSDPPNDLTGVATDSTQSMGTDAQIGRLFVVADGDGIGNILEISDNDGTTFTLQTLGGSSVNLYTLGLRSGDKYKVFCNPFDGHNHDGFNSPVVISNTHMPFMAEQETEIQGNAGTALSAVRSFKVFIPAIESGTLVMNARIKYVSTADGYVDFTLDGNVPTKAGPCTASYAWGYTVSLDVGALGLSAGWYDLDIRLQNTNTGTDTRLQGFAFKWE